MFHRPVVCYTAAMSRWGKTVFVWAAMAIIIVGLVAFQRGWIHPIDPNKFLKADVGTYRVVQFLDGDTIIVDMNGTSETVRFIGIDTPETHKPNTPVQCYGPAASAYTKGRIGTSRVHLVADTLTTNRDRYERLLRYVYLPDGTLLNQELVAKGYAFAYAFPFARSEEFTHSMEQAQQTRAGLWGNCAPTQDPMTGQWHSPPVEASTTNE